MKFVGALIFSLLAVLPSHTSTSAIPLEALPVDKLDLHFDWHKVRTLWINSGYLHTEPEIFSYIQFVEKFEQLGQTENISLSENSTLLYSAEDPVSSEFNKTSTKNYLHLLAGILVRSFCNSLVLQRRTCDELQECSELQKNETEIRVDRWCDDIAEKVENEPFSLEVIKFLDSISDPGSLSQNANLTSNSSSIFIDWSLENPEVGILFEVAAFHISYCPLKKPNEWSCSGGWKELAVEAKDGVLRTTIGDLEANTKYKLAVIALFENEMQASETKYKYVRTKNANSNGSVALASHRLCVTSALLLMFFYA